MPTKTIRQVATFKASPHEVYELLMDEKKHSQFTGGKAVITRNVGETFTIYNGEMEGINLELVPDRKIVQSWRFTNWPKGHFSKVTFSIKDSHGGTYLNFTQSGVPEEDFDSIAQGWKDYYWEPMKKLLEKK
jgi:activator of HSP90 ATPase